MAKITIREFGGMAPRINGRLLPDPLGQIAKNCDLRSGVLVPINKPTQETDHGASVPKTLWKMGSTRIIFPDGEENSVVDSPIDETNNRIFWTDGTLPKQSDDVFWDYETGWWRRLGVKAPAAAPTITLDGTAGEDVQDYVSYVYTMVTTWGEESAPSPATAVTTVMDGQHVDLSVLATPSDSYNNYEYKRIYRLSSGKAGAEYLYVGQTAYTNTTYADEDGTSLKETESDVLPTEDWDEPPSDLSGLILAHNGIFAGYAGKELYLSEPNYWYAWPSEYARVVDTDIQGLGVYNGYIIPISKRFAYSFSGSHPENMQKYQIPVEQGCVSARGVVSTYFGVLYPSNAGLCLCDGKTVKVLTAPFIDRETWDGLSPEDLVGAWYDNKYYGFFSGSNDGIIIDLERGWYVTFELETPCDKVYDTYVDGESDTLYILATNTAGDNGYTYSWATYDDNYLSYIWKSRRFVDPYDYTMAKVDADYLDSTELITNGSMAGNPVASWNAGNSASLVGEDGRLKLTENGVANPCAYQDITVNEGEVYTLSYYVKQGDASGYIVDVWDYSNSETIIYGYSETATGSWVQHSVTFTVPTGCTTVRVRLYHDADAGDGTYCYFDTVSLKQGRTSSVTFQYIKGGKLTQTETLTSNDAFRLSPDNYGTDKEIRLSGTADVRSVQLATAPREID